MDNEKAALFNWAQLETSECPQLELLRTMECNEAFIHLPVMRHNFDGLIAHVLPTSGRISDREADQLASLAVTTGCITHVCFGWVHARDSIMAYLAD